MVVVGVDMYCYVFYYVEYWDVYFVEYFYVFFCVEQCQVLWGGDDYCVGYWYFLCQGQLDVVGVWWYVYYQVVEVVLGGLGDQLDQGIGDYWFVLDYWCVVVGEEGY